MSQQATRKITFGATSSQEGAKTHFSNATTWGELKAESAEMSGLAVALKPVVKGETANSSYQLNNAGDKLPEGDFTLYFITNKNDSGK